MEEKISLKDISEKLGFNYDHTVQDWGIEYSNAERVSEFMQFYEDHITLPGALMRELMELVMASYNDKMDAGLNTPETDTEFVKFMELHANDNMVGCVARYWMAITREHNEFHVGKLLEGITFGNIESW